jgi:hypothetical protein
MYLSIYPQQESLTLSPKQAMQPLLASRSILHLTLPVAGFNQDCTASLTPPPCIPSMWLELPSPRATYSVTAQYLCVFPSFYSNSLPPLVYQENPIHPLCLSSNVLPAGSSLGIPQADQEASPESLSLSLSLTHMMHTFGYTSVTDRCVTAHVYTQVHLSTTLRPLRAEMILCFLSS